MSWVDVPGPGLPGPRGRAHLGDVVDSTVGQDLTPDERDAVVAGARFAGPSGPHRLRGPGPVRRRAGRHRGLRPSGRGAAA